MVEGDVVGVFVYIGIWYDLLVFDCGIDLVIYVLVELVWIIFIVGLLCVLVLCYVMVWVLLDCIVIGWNGL